LIRLITKLEKKLGKLGKQKKKLINAKEYHRQRINGLTDKLTNAQQTEIERDVYLTELNELEYDFGEQENLLADKNAKLAEAIAKTNNLQTQLTNEQNISQDLQAQINHHHCPTLAPHVCPIINKVDCSHSDYEEIKEDRDNYQTQLIQQEHKIAQELNNTLDLGLKEPNLEGIISKIRELLQKPSIIATTYDNSKIEQLQETIVKLEKELADNSTTSFGKNLAKIKEIDLNSLEKELNIKLPEEVIQQIQQATNYQQLSQARNSEIKKHLQQNLNNLEVQQSNQEITQQPAKERIIWIGLLLTALLTIGGLLVKLKANKGRK